MRRNCLQKKKHERPFSTTTRKKDIFKSKYFPDKNFQIQIIIASSLHHLADNIVIPSKKKQQLSKKIKYLLKTCVITAATIITTTLINAKRMMGDCKNLTWKKEPDKVVFRIVEKYFMMLLLLHTTSTDY